MLSTLMLMFVVASCNKNQAAVKKLDGTWQLTHENGQPVDADDIVKLTFTKCKLAKDEYCTLTFTTIFLGQTFTSSAMYLVMDKGETMEIKYTSQGQTSIDRFKIKELTKSKLVIEVTEGTSVSTEEYKKI